MNIRPFIRPLPLTVMLLFIVVAGIDLEHSLRREPPPLPRLLHPDTASFVMREPVLDLREDGGGSRPEPSPSAGYDASWSPPGRGGRWLLGGSAELVLETTAADYRTVAVEAKSAARMSETQNVTITINGLRCGVVEIGPDWSWQTLPIPQGAAAGGHTALGFEINDSGRTGARRRRVLVRRLGLFEDREIRSATLRGLAPLALDPASDRLGLGTSGVFEAGFEMDERVDALKLRYRFTSAEGSAEVVVRRPDGGGAGRDAPDRRQLVAAERRSGRLRVPLHGRRGEFVFRVEVDPGPPPARLDLLGVELVSEQRSSGQADSHRR